MMTQHNQELSVAIAEPNCFMSSKLKFTKLRRHRLAAGSGDADEFEAEDSSSMADAKLQVDEKIAGKPWGNQYTDIPNLQTFRRCQIFWNVT